MFELKLLYNQLGPPATYKIGSSDLGSFTCIVVLQIDYRRPLVGRPEASKPRGVDGGVGGVDPMAYRSTRAANDRRRGPTARRRGGPRLQTCVDQPTEQLSRPDLRRRASAISSPSIVSTGSAHRVVFSRPYGIPMVDLLFRPLDLSYLRINAVGGAQNVEMPGRGFLWYVLPYKS